MSHSIHHRSFQGRTQKCIIKDKHNPLIRVTLSKDFNFWQLHYSIVLYADMPGCGYRVANSSISFILLSDKHHGDHADDAVSVRVATSHSLTGPRLLSRHALIPAASPVSVARRSPRRRRVLVSCLCR